MSKNQKILATALWGVLVLAMVGVVVGQFWRPRGAAAADLPDYFPTTRFTLTDQDGKPFSDRDLRGSPYVACFIFTTCGSTCPIMSQRAEEMQPRVPANVRFVSFTVDPEHDTPAVLKEYGKRYGANNARWTFLTGGKNEMLEVAYGMKISVRPAEGGSPIVHSDKFLLIDGQGDVRGIYDSQDAQSINKLVSDAAELAGTNGGGHGA